ncbi:glucose PTS transporter subunit IIA [Enterococcus hulanensis]|uniref:PTS transporter subunit IIABC n=1 Tax=Enterococcus hulanensis TaxID=2559929 RepID=UPI0010F772DB|nr:PTS transporter subunit IIABC [Enterococcus hulanensis]MDT2659226.1 glucose PTS transporter subunit IIA [Enterococcus hulanensis]
MKNTIGKSVLDKLQKFGPAMMIVIAVIPVGGLLLGLGTIMQNETFVQDIPILGSAVVVAIASLFSTIGGLVIGNLPILFAVAIAEGLSDHDGVAALSAVISFLTLNAAIGSYLGITAETMEKDPAMYTTVLGTPTLQTGIFSGIVVGLTVAWAYKKFKNIQFPQALSFFQGKRFVPIISVVISSIVAIPFALIWPTIQSGILGLADTMVNSQSPITLYIFGLVNRLLIPFGLHNLWYPPFFFQFGNYTTTAGEIVHGDINIFLAQIADGVPVTAGSFSGGCYLFPAFCIAAALAITKMAKPENRKRILGLFSAGIVTVLFTGITEPIEFVFLFTTFPLYIIHSFFMALSFPILNLLGVHVGSTFCGGIMDFVVYGVLQNAPGWALIIPLNLVVGVLYYFLFKFIIKVFNFKTPGREDEIIEHSGTEEDAPDLAYSVYNELGGKSNISSIDACATRLRVSLNSLENVDKDAFVDMGASGVMQVGTSLQIIFGTQAAFLKEQIKSIMEGKVPSKSDNVTSSKLGEIGVSEIILSPMEGNLLSIDKVPDKVFSEEMMGTGFAIELADGKVFSPVNGKVDNIFPTKHAIGIISDEGKEILIHVGVDSVKLDGVPFEVLVEQGSFIEAGQLIMKVDLESLKSQVSVISPIIFTNLPNRKVQLDKSGKINAKEKDFFHFEERGD